MITRRCSVVALALLLSGCLTAPPHSLDISELQKYRMADVVVEGAEVVRSWPAQEEAFVSSGAADPDTVNRLQTEPASNFPALRAHMQRALNEEFKREFASQVAPIFTGARPVRAVVRLVRFDVPSGVRRVFVDTDAKIKAEIDLTDLGTGASVLKYDGPYRSKKLLGGVLAPVAISLDRSDVAIPLITEYVTLYRDWLLHR